MIVSDNKELIYNINTLICMPKLYEERKEAYEYSFKYVYMLEQSNKGVREFIEFIRNNNIKELILVNYREEYDVIIEMLRTELKIGILFDIDLASLTNEYLLNEHNRVIKLLQDKKIDKLGLTDKNLYLVAKKQFDNVYYVMIDAPVTKEYKRESNGGIGIVSISDDPKHSYFNSLSAIRLANRKANINANSEDVKNFVNIFNVNYNNCANNEEIISESNVVLYVNFCHSNNLLFLKCMDREIPCILGNNSIISKNEFLRANLQLKSDDDINEIAEKISEVEKNKTEIFNEYKKFRKEYSQKSKESIEKFLIAPIEVDKTEYEKLLTIGIPVYNVEKYLASSIESVLNAISDIKEDVEIIIVNDGSTDNSEKVILEYQNKYPELIRYINQENNGLGNVRNVILDNAKGKYISSIDSDDTINKEFYKEAWKALQEDVDIVLYDWLSIFKETEKYPTEALDNGLSINNAYKKMLYATIMPSACNKIFKKELYTKIGIRFLEGLKFEDLGTNPIILNKAETFKYINKPYYEYNIRENSIMRTKIGYNMIDVLKILDERISQYLSQPFNKEEFVAYVYFWRVEESILNQLYTLEERERKEMIEYIYSHMKNILTELYDNNKYVNSFIERVDEETKKYILERNEHIIKGDLEEFITKSLNEKSYKILTPALILYNYDNR